MIYLDYASHTPADPAVLEAFARCEAAFPANPNSAHQAGKAARQRLDEITASIARLLQAPGCELIHTSGASEANNLALKGLARAYRHQGRHIISTCLEHPSVSGTLTALQEQGYEIDLVDVGRDGRVDLAHLKSLLRKDTVIVSVCHTDSELGALQPIAGIAALLGEYPGCKLHVDATQAVGKLPVDLTGIDCLVFAPHKFHGLCGSGMLVKKTGVVLEPLVHGGAGQSLYRSGTPALALAAALETALALACGRQQQRLAAVSALRVGLEQGLAAYPGLRVNSPKNGSPYILNLGVMGVRGNRFQQKLDEHGVCVSVKSACSVPGLPSRPVYAVTGDKKAALSSWRISLSHLTTQDEIQQFLHIFDTCYKELTQ